MTRTVRNVGPALVALTLALVTMGGLAIASGTSGSSSASAASSLGMMNNGIYGTGIGYDTKANIPIGEYKMAVRFKASTTSALNSVRFVQRGGPVYSLGTGGTMTVSVRADDGSGHPSSSSLASQSYAPGNPGGNWETYVPVSFSSPPTLTAGTIYYVVFTNPDPNNYISVNHVYVYNKTSPRQPMFSDSDFGVMTTTTSTWGAMAGGYTPVVDLAYANGGHDGQSYYEAMIDRYATISGTSSMARERFTVSGGDRTVGSASIRLRRSGGTSPLVMTLENAAGAAIESVTVTAASIPVSAPGGDNGGAVWVTANFSSPHVLSDGSSYSLRISTAAGTTYTTFPVRSGTAKGINTFAFSDGTGQSTTNGSTWTDLYLYDHQDLQFYLTLVPAVARVTDLIARDTAGRLWQYPGDGSGGFSSRRQMGVGWNGVTAIVTPGDVTGDGNADVLGRDTAGRLWLYPGNGASGFLSRRQIGNGWNTMTSITKAANLNGTGRPDLLARDTTGALWLYPLTGNAVFGSRSKIGAGWNGYTILGPGDVSGDARADVLARDPAGSLWLYRGNGTGRVGGRTLVSSGWAAMTALVTPGNWDLGLGNDLLARDAAGDLWFNPGNNAGSLGVPRQIGTGWQGMTYIG